MGQRESPTVFCVVAVGAVDRFDRRRFATSLRLQIYRGLRIMPILNDCGELDRVLVGRWCFIHLVKFGTGTFDEDLVEQIWGLCSS